MKSSMRSDLTLLCLAAAVVLHLSVPALAQDAQMQVPSHPVRPGDAAEVRNWMRRRRSFRNSGSRSRDWPKAQRGQRLPSLKNPR